MNLHAMKSVLAKVRKPDEIQEVFVRYNDEMGNTKTVPIDSIVEEIAHGSEPISARKLILVVQK